MPTLYGGLLNSIGESTEIKEIQAEIYLSMENYSLFYTYKKGNEYSLTRSGDIFWYDRSQDTSQAGLIDGEPSSRSKELTLIKFEKPNIRELCLCDANLNIVKKYRSISELAKEMHELMNEDGLGPDDVYHNPRELNIDFQDEYPTKEELFNLM